MKGEDNRPHNYNIYYCNILCQGQGVTTKKMPHVSIEPSTSYM